jgi:hypothetical protein
MDGELLVTLKVHWLHTTSAANSRQYNYSSVSTCCTYWNAIPSDISSRKTFLSHSAAQIMSSEDKLIATVTLMTESPLTVRCGH